MPHRRKNHTGSDMAHGEAPFSYLLLWHYEHCTNYALLWSKALSSPRVGWVLKWLQIVSYYDFRENGPNISAAFTINHTPALISHKEPIAVTAHHTPALTSIYRLAIPRPDCTQSLTYFGFFHSARQQIPTYCTKSDWDRRAQNTYAW